MEQRTPKLTHADRAALERINRERNDASRTIQRLQRYIGQGCRLTAQSQAELEHAIQRYDSMTAQEWAILDGTH